MREREDSVLLHSHLYVERKVSHRTSGGGGIPAPASTAGMFVVIVGATALTAEPVWSGADGARYVLLRRQIALRPAKVLSATVHVAAVQSDTMERLLGAYRLYVGGKAIGMGPGRGGHRTAAYPDGGDVNHTYFDTYDVSALAKQTNYLVVGLQCYHTTGDKSAGVLLELEIALVDRTKIAVQTSSRDGLWHTFDATAAYGPTGETGQYHAPQEWAQSGLMPTGWTQTGFVIGSAWIPPATRRGTTAHHGQRPKLCGTVVIFH